MGMTATTVSSNSACALARVSVSCASSIIRKTNFLRAIHLAFPHPVAPLGSIKGLMWARRALEASKMNVIYIMMLPGDPT